MHYALLSDIGKKRSVNEDRVAVFTAPWNKELLLAIIADGMGGHRGGDYASKTAVQLIGQRFNEINQENCQAVNWEQWLKEAVDEINHHIFDLSLRNEKYKGMGTTLDIVIRFHQQCFIAHVGDSRVYQWENKHLKQLTKDHSFVNVLIESGEITEDEAKNHPNKNWIVRAVGSERRTEVDFLQLKTTIGSVLLMCTDGLTNKLTDTEIATIIEQTQTLEECAHQLVDEANAKGGEDNISVILIQMNESEVDVL
ncbi:MAG TPA: Stp1/IreP family PP2C-type Ser/Thr phosphatase [Savagea sp.]